MAGKRPQHGECDGGGISAENNDVQGGGGGHNTHAQQRHVHEKRHAEEWQQNKTRPTQAKIRATRTALLARAATATAAATLTDGDAREQSDDAAQHAQQHGHGSEHSVSTSALRTPTRTASVVVGPRRDCNTDDGHAHEYNVARQDAHGRSYKKGAQTAPAWSLEWLLARRQAYNINWLRPRERQGRTRSQHGVGNGHSTAVVSQTAAGSSLSSSDCSRGAVWVAVRLAVGLAIGLKVGLCVSQCVAQRGSPSAIFRGIVSSASAYNLRAPACTRAPAATASGNFVGATRCNCRARQGLAVAGRVGGGIAVGDVNHHGHCKRATVGIGVSV